MTENILIPTQIIKTHRKSIALTIKNNGDFIVRAPIHCTNEKILKFIQEKAEWVKKKRTEQMNNSYSPLTFIKPETISLFGLNYNIVTYDANKVFADNGILYVPNVDSKIRLISYLKRQLKAYIKIKLEEISGFTGLKYNTFSISSAKTCWGSCSFNNKLHFTYKLIMCPPEIISYIILHELCHTKVKNHSNQFWQLVYCFNPNYKLCEKWLKQNRGIIETI